MPPTFTSLRRLRRFLLLFLVLFLFVAGSVAAGCDHDHDHDRVHHHRHHQHNGDHHEEISPLRKLPEELAEEMDLELDGFGHGHSHAYHHHHHHLEGNHDADTSPLGIWLRAMGCSLLVSLASLICLIILPVIFFQGKPSKAVVDSLAVFGAGAMLGDAFLHQLPHAFGGAHSHGHGHGHGHDADHGHSHAHSLEDLSNGLSVLFGIVLFFLVEKIVRYVEDNSNKSNLHHHHHHNKKRKSSDNSKEETKSLTNDETDKDTQDGKVTESKSLHKRNSSTQTDKNNSKGEKVKLVNDPLTNNNNKSTEEPESPHSNLVFGYLNLFSDGVHNFTDGMALGSAFLLHGTVGGWSRTLFLLAHELPQEVGDFGILVRSGFTVSKALFFNFLSALVALAGTALALVLGTDPGHSSLIEGFTAGGFIYIAVAGVLPEMNEGKTTVRGTAVQLISLLLGMLVALSISLVE